jgi:CHASE3 domain sensor protein
MVMPNTSNGAWVNRLLPIFERHTLVFVLFALLGLIAAAAVIFSIVDVKKDGYRRVPERKLVRIF